MVPAEWATNFRFGQASTTFWENGGVPQPSDRDLAIPDQGDQLVLRQALVLLLVAQRGQRSQILPAPFSEQSIEKGWTDCHCSR